MVQQFMCFTTGFSFIALRVYKNICISFILQITLVDNSRIFQINCKDHYIHLTVYFHVDLSSVMVYIHLF